jgi:hypothetical protein
MMTSWVKLIHYKLSKLMMKSPSDYMLYVTDLTVELSMTFASADVKTTSVFKLVSNTALAIKLFKTSCISLETIHGDFTAIISSNSSAKS